LHARETDKRNFASLNDLLIAPRGSENTNIDDILAKQGIETTRLITAFLGTGVTINQASFSDEAGRLIREWDEDKNLDVTISVH
jgi:hypothetical protein